MLEIHISSAPEKSFKPYLYGIKRKTEERETAENASNAKSSAALEQVIEGAGTKAEHRVLEMGEASEASEDMGKLPRNRHLQPNQRKHLFKPRCLKLETCFESLMRH